FVPDPAERSRRAFPYPPALVPQAGDEPLDGRCPHGDKTFYGGVPAFLDRISKEWYQGFHRPCSSDFREGVGGIHPNCPIFILEGFDQGLRRFRVRLRSKSLRRFLAGRVVRVSQRFK